MNIQSLDILNAIHTKPFSKQRNMAKETEHSLGIVNHCIKELMEKDHMFITAKVISNDMHSSVIQMNMS